MCNGPGAERYDAGTVAESSVAETKSVGMPCASIATDEDAMKLEPVIAICVSTDEIGNVVGVTVAKTGTGFWGTAMTVNVRLAVVPPPGAGDETAIACVPGLTMAAAGIDAARWLASTNVVARRLPSRSACDAGTKLDPVSVIAVTALPCVALVGAISVRTGSGFAGGATRRVNGA